MQSAACPSPRAACAMVDRGRSVPVGTLPHFCLEAAGAPSLHGDRVLVPVVGYRDFCGSVRSYDTATGAGGEVVGSAVRQFITVAVIRWRHPSTFVGYGTFASNRRDSNLADPAENWSTPLESSLGALGALTSVAISKDRIFLGHQSVVPSSAYTRSRPTSCPDPNSCGLLWYRIMAGMPTVPVQSDDETTLYVGSLGRPGSML